MSIDDIAPNTKVVLTAGMKRLFAAAGCSPTACHACKEKINVGDVFKLVSHKGTDEMCCAKCGKKELTARDKAAAAIAAYQPPTSDWSPGQRLNSSGYSRPSKAKS